MSLCFHNKILRNPTLIAVHNKHIPLAYRTRIRAHEPIHECDILHVRKVSSFSVILWPQALIINPSQPLSFIDHKLMAI